MALLQSLQLPLGTDIIPFQLPGVDGKTYTDKSFTQAQILVIVFTCNHCPYAQASEPYLIELGQKYQSRGVAVVAINANDATQYSEDSFEEMKKRAQEKNYPYPYLHDETQAVAKSYQAQCTPDIYVFDEQRKLRYHGRVNDVRTAEDVATTHDLEDALEALLAGKEPSADQKPSMGCSIKWKRGQEPFFGRPR